MSCEDHRRDENVQTGMFVKLDLKLNANESFFTVRLIETIFLATNLAKMNGVQQKKALVFCPCGHICKGVTSCKLYH